MGNQALNDLIRSRGGSGGRDPEDAFEAATRGSGGPVPYREEMEEAFGRDFSDVRCHLGQRDAVAGTGARALARGNEIAFATSNPDRELVAHELTHVVQQEQAAASLQSASPVSRRGDAAEREAGAVAAAVVGGRDVPPVGQAPTGRVSGDWLDDVIDRVGDALDMREDEERLDAEEELEEFRGRSFPAVDPYQPPTGVGQFAVQLEPASGDERRLLVTVRVFFEFVSGDPGQVAPGFRPEEFQWNDGDRDAWKRSYLSELSAAWSSPATGLVFHSSRRYWESLEIPVEVSLAEDTAPATAHFVVRVAKYPSDAAMVQSSVCGPGRHHTASGGCAPNTAPGTPPAYAGISGSTVRLDSNDLRPEAKLDWGNPVVQVPFPKGTTALDAAGRRALAPVIQQMRADPSTHAQLTGHASSDHPMGANAQQGATHNMDLARGRTDAVKHALNAAGITDDRLLVRNLGEHGASPDASWCRVDVQVGSQSVQVPAVHEAGHMLGNSDEYPSAGATPAYDALVQSQTGIVVSHTRNASVMSLGSTIQPWNYAVFLAALKRVTGMEDWTL